LAAVKYGTLPLVAGAWAGSCGGGRTAAGRMAEETLSFLERGGRMIRNLVLLFSFLNICYFYFFYTKFDHFY
jgi:hypothetical protein